MGFVRKISGVQAQITATHENAQAQAKATKQASDAQAQSLMNAAKAAADQQAQMTARTAAEDAASEAMSTPLGTADVQLDANPTESVTATRAKRKASFGRNYASGGVAI